MKVCAVGGSACHGRLAIGLCMKHYQRLRKTGSTDDPKPLLDHWTRYKVNVDGCWIWNGPLNEKGYGILSRPYQGTTVASKGFYLRFKGSIAEGLQVDHLCRVRCCVNPDHLEAVTPGTNMDRGICSYTLRTLCRAGLHDITNPQNIRMRAKDHRTCRECWLEANRRGGAKYRARLKAETGSTRPRHRESPDHTGNRSRSQQNPMGPQGTGAPPPPPGTA